MPSNGWKNWHWICLFKLSPMMCFYLSPEGRRNKQSYTIEFQRKENGLNLSKGYLLQWGTCMNSKPRHLQVSSFQILVTYKQLLLNTSSRSPHLNPSSSESASGTSCIDRRASWRDCTQSRYWATVMTSSGPCTPQPAENWSPRSPTRALLSRVYTPHYPRRKWLHPTISHHSPRVA